MVLKTQKAQLA